MKPSNPLGLNSKSDITSISFGRRLVLLAFIVAVSQRLPRNLVTAPQNTSPMLHWSELSEEEVAGELVALVLGGLRTGEKVVGAGK